MIEPLKTKYLSSKVLTFVADEYYKEEKALDWYKRIWCVFKSWWKRKSYINLYDWILNPSFAIKYKEVKPPLCSNWYNSAIGFLLEEDDEDFLYFMNFPFKVLFAL